jgi:TPR repeat protein
VEDSHNQDVKGHALFQIGQIYQFAQGVPQDHEIAQLYYDKALETKASEKVPIYLMNFWNRWQSVDFVHHFDEFVQEAFNEPYSRGGLIVAFQVCYIIALLVVVRMLRKDSQREQQEA